ncbi:caspase family protein [Kamptonema cortianum]|nr:caspase family protein [Geitlerinema splendidum]MDK3158839.1 caspase family protein [Kamptonema cortianum]
MQKTDLKARAIALLLIFGVVATSLAQGWQSSYEKALAAAKTGDWSAAQAEFQAAIQARPHDSKDATNLPGPVTEPNRWRNGAPYSPNFGAAYATYRLALGNEDEEAKSAQLKEALKAFQSLIDSGQASAEAIGIVRKVALLQGDRELASSILKTKVNWRVDNAFILPEDRASGEGFGTTIQGEVVTTKTPSGEIVSGPRGTILKVKAPDQEGYENLLSERPVEPVLTKFAIIIGNADAKNSELALPHAATDSETIRKSLVEHAGYLAENVAVHTNVNGADIKSIASTFAEKLTTGSTVVIFYNGAGVHLGGKDYLVGTDAEFATDTTKMVGKQEFLRPLFDKGAQVFLFAQTNRPIVSGDYFGKERVLSGMYSEAHATTPGGQVFSLVTEGERIGLYAFAVGRVLKKFHTNQVPVGEFCWNVFYQMRGGDGFVGGSGAQTPTLPVFNIMSDDSRF